jgi:O-antigen/teichoic acid export membrane protein
MAAQLGSCNCMTSDAQHIIASEAVGEISATSKRVERMSVTGAALKAASARRDRLAKINGVAAAIARASQVGIWLLTVPLAIRYLGNERFGLWMTINSVMAMATFADFGLGNGVLNSISSAYGRENKEEIRRVISNGLAVLTLIAAVLFGFFLFSYPFISWPDLFRVTSHEARAEAGRAVLVFAACFALNIPLGVIQRIQMGLQENYITSAWQLCGSLLGFVGAVIGMHEHASLAVLLACITGAPVLASALNVLQFFAFRHRDLRPARGLISRATIAEIAHLGGLFFVLQIVVALAYSADNLIIARVGGAVNVPEYSIPQRMFSLISLLATMFLSPLWPAYGEAISRGDLKWVRNTLSRTLKFALAGSVLGSMLLLLLSHRLILCWIGPRIHPPFALLLGLAIWTVFDCCGNTVAMFLNGASVVRFQIIFASLFGIACLVTKVMLVRRFGIVALPWTTIATYASLSAIPCVIYVPRLLQRMKALPQMICIPQLAHEVVED